MSKRRLSQQQQRRTRAARERALSQTDDTTGPPREGLVIVRYGKRALIEDGDGERRQCVMRANLEDLVAGDEVIWRTSSDSGVIESRAERRSALFRPDARARLRPIAANIDLMLVVIAPKPPPHANLIDRYLVAAENAGIEAVLVLNKDDLLTENPEVSTLTQQYADLGYRVIQTGADSDPEAEALKRVVPGKTVVLVGQSGVGKSSLIKRLLPDHDIRVGELSDAIDKGRHTTTAAELYHLPGGGRLIDSPGIREFHLDHIPADAVAAGFREFREFLGHCRFRDCSHDHEADCAILDAVADGRISEERLASYRLIVNANTP